MKKILLISLVMLLAVSVSFSQFGIKAGINLATVSGADKSLGGIDPTHKLGLAGGISYRIGLIAGLAIQPEVMYIQKGAIYDGNMSIQGFSISGKTTLSGNYIDIPVLVKFNLPIPVFSPYIEGGASYGILLSAKQKTEAGGQSEETDIKDQFSKSDVSLIVGVGVEFLILEIDARMVLGQTKLGKNSDAKVFNNGIIFTAGLRF
jgi:hypothetical protein